MNMMATDSFSPDLSADVQPILLGIFSSGPLAGTQNIITAQKAQPASWSGEQRASGPLQAVKLALAAGHLEGAKKILADFRRGQTAVFKRPQATVQA